MDHCLDLIGRVIAAGVMLDHWSLGKRCSLSRRATNMSAALAVSTGQSVRAADTPTIDLAHYWIYGGKRAKLSVIKGAFI